MGYDMILPAIPFLAGYLLTYAMYRTDTIKKSVHISLWNLIILIAFIISGGAGFILLILLELGISLQLSPQLLYWHVELGITLALVTIFHFHAHWKSTKAMFLQASRRSKA